MRAPSKKPSHQVSQYSNHFLNLPKRHLISQKDLISKDSWIVNKIFKEVTSEESHLAQSLSLSLNVEWQFHDPELDEKYVPRTCKGN